MATLDELKLQQLLRPFEGPGGIASLNPLAFQYQNQQYLNQDPTQDFYQPNNISPTQDFYPLDRNPTQMFYQPREFVNAPGAINYYQPDLTTLRGLDMNRFQGVSDMSLIDETTNDEQDQNYIEQVEKSRNPLSGIMDLLRNIPTPFNLARRGLESLRGFNQKIRNTDFAKSSTLADYLDARSYGGRDARDRAAQQNMREARAIQRQVDRRGDSTSRVADRNRSSVTRSSAARSRGVGGGGYTASDSNRESYRGR